jgi:hypothetical protein
VSPWLSSALGLIRMQPLEVPANIRMFRAILLAVGCAPMVLAHGLLSLLMIFPLVSFVSGDWRQGLFLLWWFIGTGSLGVLVYSSATYAPGSRRLPTWQVLGLLAGILVAVPLTLGFAGEWWIALCAVLGASAAAYILVSTRRFS